MIRAKRADTLRQPVMSKLAPEFMPHAGPTSWARVVALLIEFATRRGAPKQLLIDAGELHAAVLDQPDARVPLLALYAVIEKAAALTNDPCLGLHFAISLKLEDLDALGFLMITSSTLGDSLERMLRYQRLWNEGEKYAMQVTGDSVRFTYEQYGPRRPAHAQMAQMALCDFAVNGPRFVPGLEVDEVRFREPLPPEVEEYERIFQRPVVFGARVDEVRFPTRLLELSLPDANEALCRFFERYAGERIQRLPQSRSLRERVRALLRKGLPDAKVKLEHIAAELHMSQRTLQRRLSDEGTSVHAELDEVRRQQALYFLETGAAIAELSWLLGYAEPSAFHRAFKRWTGQSPEAWRAEANRSPE